MFGLTDGAPEALSRTGMPAHWNAEQHTEPIRPPAVMVGISPPGLPDTGG